jgi:hypothetical protein
VLAGLKQARTLATGTGLGTTHLSAALTLNVPTTTVAGTYTATLTLTAIRSSSTDQQPHRPRAAGPSLTS